MKTLKAILLIGTAIVSLVACGGSTPPTPVELSKTSLVGKIENSDALIAIVRDENSFIAYICGGKSTWQTHTGWFRSDTISAKGNFLESSSGLKFSANFADSSAKGTLTLKDGTTLSWSTEAAKKDAGLFVLEEAGLLAGVITDNDGNVAGTARAIDPKGAFLSSPVKVQQALDNRLVVQTQRLGIDIQLEIDRLRKPSGAVAQPAAPTIIVLLHGLTSQIGASSPEELALSGMAGTRRHARLYWTEPFTQSLLGGTKHLPLVTLGSADVSGNKFYTDALPATPNEVPNADICDLDDFVTTQDRFSTTVAPNLSVLLTHRRAGLGLVEQAMDASAQINRCQIVFRNKYNVMPKFVFMGHSMGGIVTRFMLSSPTQTDVETAITNGFVAAPTAGRLASYASSFNQMGFIRDRTMYVLTLASPHEGSRLADQPAKFQEKLQQVINWIESGNPNPSSFGLSRDDVLMVERLTLAVAPLLALSGKSQDSLESRGLTRISAPQTALVNAIRKVITLLNFDTPTTTGIQDVDSATWKGLNTGLDDNNILDGLLHPRQMTRGSDSPIPNAARKLIPVHVAGARKAGAEVYDSLSLNQIQTDLKRYNLLNPIFDSTSRFVKQVTQSMIGHVALWAVAGAKPALDPRLDKINYTDWLTETTRATEVALAANGFPSTMRLWRYAKSRVSSPINDAMVTYLLSTLSGTGGSPKIPAYLKSKWEVNFNGTVSARVPALVCQDANGNNLITPITINLELFLQVLVRGGRTLEAGINAFTTTSMLEMLSEIRKISDEYKNIATDIINLIAPTLSTLANLPVDCKGPLGTTPGDIFTGDPLNLKPWKFVLVTQEISAPQIVETSLPNTDGFVEQDALVEYDSALGFKLGTTIVDYFDHTRTDHTIASKPSPGSWYRFYTSGVEQFNHEIMHAAVGAWISDTFLENATPAGAFVCAAGTISSPTPCN
jgi:hypothetical protein